MASPRGIEDFEVTITGDGSPSLRIKDVSGYVEKMHHSDGALSESLYIYGDAIDEVFKRGWPLSIVSLGLGLGYNELIAAAKCVQRGIEPSETFLYSFEIEPFLRDNFRQWITNEPSELASLYEQIHTQIQTTLKIEKNIKHWLQIAWQKNRWRLLGDFLADSHGIEGVTCFFYDAFSNKMSPELWNENEITAALNRMCGKGCVLSTYAATGALNRSLKYSGFTRYDRAGFSGKRESTFAIRNTNQK